MNRLKLRIARARIAERAKKDNTAAANDWRGQLAKVLKFSKVLYFVVGLVLGLAIEALSIPKSILEFKNNFGQAKKYLTGIIYRPSNWTGVFDAFPEGIVDMNDIGIFSSVDAALEIEAAEGNLLEGRVWWVGSCDFGGPYQGLLIEGLIHAGGYKADVQIFDFVNGHRVPFIEGQLARDGQIVEFADFPKQSGLNGSRIAKNPEPALLENWSDLYCE